MLKEQDELNGEEPFVCPVAKDWPIHRQEAKDAMGKISSMHATIAGFAGYIRHLEKLDDIATTLGNLNDNLVGPATGRRQVPLAVVMFLFAIMACFIFIVYLRDSNTDVSIDSTGFHLRHPPRETK